MLCTEPGTEWSTEGWPNGLARQDGGGLSAMNTGKGMVTLVRAFPVSHTHAMEIPAVVTNELIASFADGPNLL